MLQVPEARRDSQFISQARASVHDLFTPRPYLYWLDYLTSISLGYACGAYYLSTPFGSALSVLALVVASAALYRASLFIHEVVHFRRDEMRGFYYFWNLTGGVVMLMPSFLYESHIVHHNTQHYGTEGDGEYLPLGRGRVWGLLIYLSQILTQPLFIFSRFLIGTPISFLHPKLRRWVLERTSSLVINFRYRRQVSSLLPNRDWFVLEVLCFLRATALLAVVACGFAPWTRIPKIYLLACVALGLNHLRTLAAHRYQSEGETVDHRSQFLDSTNIRGGWLTEIICPLGLRYHALHHLFPSLPYHALGVAHRRLMSTLPKDSEYRDTEYPSFRSVIAELWQVVRCNSVHAAGQVPQRVAANPVGRSEVGAAQNLQNS